MLTDQILNIICIACTCESKNFNTEIGRNCSGILKFYDNDRDEEIPQISSLKYQFAKTAAKLKQDGLTVDTILDSIKSTRKFDSLSSYISILEQRDTTNLEAQKICEAIKKKKMFLSSMHNFGDLRNFVETYETDGFNSTHDAMDNYGKVITDMYSTYSTEKRNENVSSLRSLDFRSDGYENVFGQIKENYSQKNSVPSGFGQMDRCMNNGFEPGRLYIFGGIPNDGKSTLLMNFCKNAMSTRRRTSDEIDIYVYITLENFIDESFLRLYSSLRGTPIKKILANYDDEKSNCVSIFKDIQETNNTCLDMAYFPPASIAVPDITMYLKEVEERYEGKAKIRCLYIDYLDLLRSGKTFDMHRLELGQVTIDLKVLASAMQIPVVTLTQLNRAAYNKKEGLGLDMVGESIKKVEHADFFGLIRHEEDPKDVYQQNATGNGTMNIHIGKNRSGPKNKTISLRTDFSTYSIIDMDRKDTMEFEDVDVDASDNIL
jgi:replicative DNA helicase